jgi:hypothetical protein
MKLIKTLKMAAIAGVALLAVKSEASFTSFANFGQVNPNRIVFSSGGTTTGTFNFTLPTTDPTATSGQWQIVTKTGGFDSSILNLYGSVLSPLGYSYGITTLPGFSESANVSGAGTLEISDASGSLLKGTVKWLTLTSLGVNEALNTMLSVNITGLTYGGSNVGLQQLLNQGNASGAGITVTFSSGGDLYALASGGGSFPFTGTIAVPEPATMVAGALLLLPFGASTIRFVRKNRLA